MGWVPQMCCAVLRRGANASHASCRMHQLVKNMRQASCPVNRPWSPCTGGLCRVVLGLQMNKSRWPYYMLNGCVPNDQRKRAPKERVQAQAQLKPVGGGEAKDEGHKDDVGPHAIAVM